MKNIFESRDFARIISSAAQAWKCGPVLDRKLRLWVTGVLAAQYTDTTTEQLFNELLDVSRRRADSFCDIKAPSRAIWEKLPGPFSYNEYVKYFGMSRDRFYHWLAARLAQVRYQATQAMGRIAHDAVNKGDGTKQTALNLLWCCIGQKPINPGNYQPHTNEHAAPRLAKAILEGRKWGELPILADALEEAGFEDNDALSHLRQPEHCYGCNVLDFLIHPQLAWNAGGLPRSYAKG